MNNLLVIGSIYFCTIIDVKDLNFFSKNLISDSFTKPILGGGIITSIMCSNLKVKTNFIGSIGQNDKDRLLSYIYKFKLDNFLINATFDVETGKKWILFNCNKAEQKIYWPGANYNLTVADIKKQINLIKNSNYLVIENCFSSTFLEYALFSAKKHNSITILHSSSANKISLKIAKNTDYLIVNEHDIYDLNFHNVILEKNKINLVKAASNLLCQGIKCVIIINDNFSATVINDQNIYSVLIKINSDQSSCAVNEFYAENAFVSLLAKGLIEEVDLDIAVHNASKECIALSSAINGYRPGIYTF